ncbi:MULTISPECIES: PTS glucitol/sorbitol transporter subunit IIC [Propionispora]|uniref:PTS system, glucitol/sorbitol-specific IIC component n=2 Tax=Propionispora TaxID=112902 RepID=A0A1H8XS11_9FIRM|nr:MULTISPECIES: PTS glucitol/sorbitol transporter subunit IIC [Propionispora]SEP42541.1 PTS system, glucitol/sorbitol-specific IIC component [Propionispora vibrioides]SHI90794.1 PTS system, glucitol/sorbitol-specific IIC component [Propionispora hippei DSM 15287]
MDLIANLANGFMNLFKAGATTFSGWVVGIIPLIVILMTAVSAFIKLIGEERIHNLAQTATKNVVTRYTILPILAVLFLGNPMCYSFGRFVDNKHKPAYYDATVSFLHPVTGLFPHANGGELFVYMGIAAGITTLGFPLGELAVRYFLVGVIVIFIRGLVTEKIYATLKAREK